MTGRLSRRGFLLGTGSLAVGFTLAGHLGEAQAAKPTGELLVAPSPSSPLAWLVLTPGGYTVHSGKVELGTGTQTAMSQIVAEELRLDVADLRYVQGDTAITPNQGVTAGSKTLQTGAPSLRQAAATAYAALLAQAAAYLGVPADSLEAHRGRFQVAGTDTSVSYRYLLGQVDTVLVADPHAPLVSPDDYRVVGTSVPRVDLPDKVTARFAYTCDVVVPGMLHGRVIRPSGRNATFASVGNLARAQQVPGFVQVVQRQNFVGVVAESEWAAATAANPATGVTVSWNAGAPLLTEADLPAALRDPANQYATSLERDDGDVDAVFAASTPVEAQYFTPFQMHGTVGASAAVADVRSAPDPVTGVQATVWSGTQGVNNLQGALSQLLGLPLSAVHVVYVEDAGCYGHDGADDAAADAALLSQAVGVPVWVQWTRQNEHGWEPLGPAQAHDLRGCIDDTGHITAWEHVLYAASHNARPSAGNPGSLIAGQLLGGLPDPLPASAGDLSGRNSEVTYALANQRVVAKLVRSYVTTGPTSRAAAAPLVWTLPRSSALRSLGGFSNTFANESFLDELAHTRGLDPLQLRRDLITNPRGSAVLAALVPPWNSRPTGDGVGAGVAYQQYELVNAYAATYVEVTVDRDTGTVRVGRVVVAHDCGLIVNPDGLRHQIEGNVIQGVSRALTEEVHYSGDAITTTLWAPPPGTTAPQYRVIHFSEVPTVECILIDRPDQPALGAGEPAIGTLGAAIGNAVFAATGVRFRRLPLTPQRVLAGLA